MAKKKILAYWADTQGCGYYRMVLPYLELHRRGDFDVKLTAFLRMNDMMKADAIVFQRQHQDPVMLGLLTAKKFGKVVISENDDLLFALPAYNQALKIGFNEQSFNTLRTVLQISDALSLSTPDLVKAHEKDNPIRYCVPNFIDEAQIRMVPQSETPAIVWAGAAGHDGDIMIVKQATQRYFRDHPASEFHAVGYDYRLPLTGHFSSTQWKFHKTPWKSSAKFLQDQFINKHNVLKSQEKEWSTFWEFDGWEDRGHQVLGVRIADALTVLYPLDRMVWESETYYGILADTSATMGIAPICMNVFNSCKSYNKILEYAMLGIPSIASDWGQYHEVVAGMDPYTVKQSKEAFAMAAMDPSSWYKAMCMLSSLKELRERMSRKALEWAKTKTIQKNAHLWTNMINELIEKKKEKKAA